MTAEHGQAVHQASKSKGVEGGPVVCWHRGSCTVLRACLNAPVMFAGEKAKQGLSDPADKGEAAAGYGGEGSNKSSYGRHATSHLQ